MMNLMHLKYFQAVAMCQTVSAAAEYLHISQPSLSGAVRSLENEFGVLLFRRHHRGMELTSEGEVLFKLCGDLLRRAEHLEERMRDLGRERKTLRLGVPPMIGSLLLPEIYNGFLSAHPDIRLEITEGGRQEITGLLSEGYLDMGFLPHTMPLSYELAALPVDCLEIVCCAAKNSLLAQGGTVNPSALRNTPLVLFEDSFFQTGEIKKWFAAGGVEPDILLQTAQLSTMIRVISEGIANGFMFRRLIEDNPELVAVPTEKPISINVSLVWKRDAYFFGCMRSFRNFVQGMKK